MHSSTIKLSVIIPLYNQEKRVLIGLDSIPERDDIEVIVIDDCSTDDSYRVVKSLNRNIILLQNERNRGAGYTEGVGIDAASGEYITQLDSDGDYFVGLENGMEHLDGTDFICFPQKIKNGTFMEIYEGSKGKYTGTAKFLRREFVGDTRPPHWENCEDNKFYEDLLKKNPTEKLIRNMFYFYNYPREGSLTWNALNNITPRKMERK